MPRVEIGDEQILHEVRADHMTNDYELGHVVWHDLMTNDVVLATGFYQELLGWDFEVEHAVDFVWKAGEADYPLIMANGTAHGGIVDARPTARPRWLAYIATHDVDTVTAKAVALGATIIRGPFDIPGVGRASVTEDTGGAVFCPYTRNHRFPAPSGTFLWDELVTGNLEAAARFYGELFAWTVESGTGPTGRAAGVFKNTNGDTVGGVTEESLNGAGTSTWLPYLATEDLGNTLVKAKALGASVQPPAGGTPTAPLSARLADPGGACFGLITAGKSKDGGV